MTSCKGARFDASGLRTGTAGSGLPRFISVMLEMLKSKSSFGATAIGVMPLISIVKTSPRNSKTIGEAGMVPKDLPWNEANSKAEVKKRDWNIKNVQLYSYYVAT